MNQLKVNLILSSHRKRQAIPTAEQCDDRAEDTIPQLPAVQNAIENNDDKPSAPDDEPEVVPAPETINAIANNNNDLTVNNGIKEAKTNGNCVVDVTAVVAGKNVSKKKNKKGKDCDTAA